MIASMQRLAAMRLLSSVLALLSTGCLVGTFHPAYDEASIVFDEGLVGTWENSDSQITVVVARSQWRSYEISYTERTTTTRFTGFLTDLSGTRLLDVRPMDGQDRPAFLVVTNGVFQVVRDGEQVRVRELDYDEVVKRVSAGRLGTAAASDQRQNVILTAETPVLRKWLATALRDPGLWGEWKVLSKATR